MAFKRHRRGRRKFKRRRKTRFRMRKGPLALRMVRSLKRKVGLVEEKYLEVAGLVPVGFGTESPPIFTQELCLTAQGDDYFNRQGMKISIQRIVWRSHINIPAAATSVAHIRFILVKFPLDVGAVVPLLGNVLRFTSDGTAASVSLYQKNTTPTVQPFRVLMDKTMSLNYGGTTPSRNFIFTYKFRKPLVISYSGSGAVIDNVSKNFLVLYAFSSSVANHPVMNYMTRVYYTDV